MTMGAGKSGARVDSKVESAWIPPAEEPMTMSWLGTADGSMGASLGNLRRRSARYAKHTSFPARGVSQIMSLWAASRYKEAVGDAVVAHRERDRGTPAGEVTGRWGRSAPSSGRHS